MRIEGGQLRYPSFHSGVTLAPELSQKNGDRVISHPAYLAAFTMIGSPW